MPPFVPFKILAPCPLLGYGYDIDEFWHTIETERPAAIISDAGSTDPGPYMLGSGKTVVSRASYVTDLTPILDASAKHGIKVLIGSAGGAGSDAQVDFVVDVVRQIARARGHHFLVATIKFEASRDDLVARLREGKITPCASAPPLQEADVRDAVDIVAQMGAEPFRAALANPAVDIIVAGRSYDPAPFAAFSMHHGVQPEPAWHVGKIVECGGQCATPKGRSMLATMYEDHFVLTPTNPHERCTPLSVAAHTMYEKTRPDRLPGPGGVLHLGKTVYEPQPDGRSLLVRGSEFVPSPTYQIKLEGAALVGYRSCFIGGIRDPILIAQIDDFLEHTVRRNTTAGFSALGTDGGPRLIFHVYGRNAVMGPLEPLAAVHVPHEVGVLGEVVAATQDEADAIANLARICTLHNSYPGQMATAGNFASPLTPLEQSLGPVYRFSVYHLLDVEDPTSHFRIDTVEVGEHTNGTSTTTNGSAPAETKTAVPATATVPAETAKPVAPASATARARTFDSPSLTIADVASVVRSKNAGPFEITLDVIFDDAALYAHVRDSNVLTRERIRTLYGFANDDDIVALQFFEPALGWKCTYKRSSSQLQGSVGERDTFGAQLHAPLLSIPVPPIRPTD
ncbi:hypothetical protein SEUCBS140593_010354 [Sporothrix eucalyptigena]|uniref:Caib baif family enzyme n=1 Tax=Sporothrix eucalyptigena TaxID=1812306 RepID=A0ABP0D267_9PEZI